MKKWISLFLCIILMMLLCSCGVDNADADSSIYWIKEESSFVDYEISGDIVRFRYSICFVNEMQEHADVKIAAKFSGKELSRWIENKDYFEGLDDHGEWNYQRIKSGEKAQLIYTFEGKYLGGDVNEKLSFPQELILSLDADG